MYIYVINVSCTFKFTGLSHIYITET
jgi:hypothetical protein